VLATAAVLVAVYLAAPAHVPRTLAVASEPPPAAPTAGGATQPPIVLVPVTPAPGMTTGPSQPATPGPPPPIALGAFIPGASSDPTRIDAYARLTGAVPKIVMWYQQWTGDWPDFAPHIADAIRSRGATPMISWEPTAGPVLDPSFGLRSIVDGSHDGYIASWTHAVAAWGHELYVRPMYEMNGWWAPWCVRVNGNNPTLFVAAWRHIVGIARREGATNIRWVWSPNVDNDGLGVPFADLYPGDGYVDWVALDGFNRGTSWKTSTWVSVKHIFAGSIARLRAFTQKPLMIAETGSSEVGGSKADWIRTSFANIPRDLPDVRAIVWFDKLETAVGIDWRVDSSAASLAAFRAVATSDAFSGSLP
jgi:hypothetical protein